MSLDVSELIDGELDDQAAQRVLLAMRDNPQARQAWDDYHAVGDALRGVYNETSTLALRTRVMAALDAEPTILAPARQRTEAPSRWVRYSVAAAAGVAALGMMSWLAPTQQGGTEQVASMDKLPSAVQATAQKQSGTIDFEPYLRAHREAYPAIQPAAFTPNQ